MLTLPNVLTFLRILAVPAFVACLLHGAYRSAYLLFMGASITDTIDGALARLTNSRSEIGALLDPLADKVLLASAFLVLGWLRAVPVWLVAIVIGRDLVVVSGYYTIRFLHGRAMPINPTPAGKANTFFELFTVAFVLLALARPSLPIAEVNDVIPFMTATTTMLSGFEYVQQGLAWHRERGSDRS